MELADAVDEARRAQRQRRHVEERPAAVVVVAEREEGITRRAERSPRAGQMRLDQIEREGVVARGDRRVGREDRRPPDFLERRVEALAVLDQVANALQDDECGVAFVQMPGRG